MHITDTTKWTILYSIHLEANSFDAFLFLGLIYLHTGKCIRRFAGITRIAGTS